MDGRAPTNRRGFLTGKSFKSGLEIYPPGATAQTVASCTACGECVTACPEKIIAIRNGVPVLDFRETGCTFCGKCSERCPERVFPPQPVRHLLHTAAIAEHCLALNYVDCQACRDCCVTDAIRFVPRRGGPFSPNIDPDSCVGCGACVSTCPVDAIEMSERVTERAHA